MHKYADYHKDHIRQCFNRAVLTYDKFSYPQQVIGEKLINYLSDKLVTSEAMIDLGCGTGIVTEKLLSKIACGKVVAIDISDKLLAQAEQRLLDRKIQIYHQDFDQLILPDQRFDLVFSSMALQWSTDLPGLLLRLNQYLSSEGLLAFAIPLAGTFNELKSTSKNRFYNLEFITSCLLRAGFLPLIAVSLPLIVEFRSWRKALAYIKATGANYVFSRVNKSLAVSSLFCDQGKSNNLTYQVGYFIGRKQRVA